MYVYLNSSLKFFISGFIMNRSLVLAAKVKCAQWGYVSDEPNCDQRLSKIDLFGLLVSHGCASLIPKETTSHGLRRLQTQLLEAELWELALEVSEPVRSVIACSSSCFRIVQKYFSRYQQSQVWRGQVFGLHGVRGA